MALRRGVDLEINWVGRWSVWLTMGGIFLALATSAWIGTAMFLVGLVGSLLASALYVNTGLRQARDE
jgi:cardiolipin synthase